MYLIVSLPLSRNCDAMMVFVCRVTKMAHFIPTRTNVNAPETADKVYYWIVRLHGVSSTIVSDLDPRLVSEIWNTLFQILETSLHFSSAYHSQTDGQTDRVNRALQVMIRHYIIGALNDWVNRLANIQFPYNSSLSESTKFPSHPSISISVFLREVLWILS